MHTAVNVETMTKANTNKAGVPGADGVGVAQHVAMKEEKINYIEKKLSVRV